MSPGLPILYICSIAGLLVVIGSFVLLWKGRIYLDRETKQVTEIELPLGIKMKTNLPVIMLILIGGALLVYASTEVRKFGEEITVDGDLSGSTASIQLYASVAATSLPRGGPFSLSLPVTHPSRKYMLLYAVNGDLLAHQVFDPETGQGSQLPALQITLSTEPELIGDIDPMPAGY